MKNNNYLYFTPSKSIYSNKTSNYYHYPSTPKNNSSPINIYNFNYLTKIPSTYINVFCRFRPINELEFLYSKKEALQTQSSKHLILKTESQSKLKKEFIFDEIFEPNINKSSFYNKVCRNIVKNVMLGYNGGIILYGEYGSGKTYIIKEIIPKIIRQIYEEISISYFENELFKIEAAVYEIYNEQIDDLLKLDNTNLNLIELKNKRVIINNLTYISISSEEQLNDVIMQGLNNKSKYNNNVKSHCIIEIKIYRYYKDKKIMKYSTLYIAELEGIEYHCDEVEISEEQKIINKSIDALQMVVKRLNERNDKDEEEIHIPYRNSKLTRILSDCFGGNAYTSLILTCSKSEYHINKTKNIFILGENIRKIKNKPLINVEINADKNPSMKGIIDEDNKKVSKELNNLKQLNRKYQNEIEQKDNEIKELNDTIDILKYEKQNNINLHNQFNNLSKENGELNNKTILLTQKLSDEISNNKKISEDNNILKQYTQTVINNLLSDKNYYVEKNKNFKNEIEELKLIIKKKENESEELNNELKNKKKQIILLQLENEKLKNKYEDILSEKNEIIQNMEENISNERTKMENNLYSQIKNSEAIIRELREAKDNSDIQVNKYKNNVENLNIKIKQLELKYKNLIEEKDKKNNDLELQINNNKMKLSQLTSDIYLKDSTIKKMNGEIQILKSELSNNNNNNLLNNNDNKLINNKNNNEMTLSFDEIQNYISSIKNKENDDKKIIDNYNSKIKDLQNELNNIKLKQNNENNLVNHKLLKMNDLEKQLKDNQNLLEEYKNKYILTNKELNEAKNLVFDLNKEKEILLKEKNNYYNNTNKYLLKDKEIFDLKENNEKTEIKNKEQERELILLKKRIQNIEKENESLRKKMNDYEEIKLELEGLKNRGSNYKYIEINKSSLKENYDKLLEENKKLKQILEQNK